MDGLSVVSVNGRRHAILLVGDLGSTELTQLSRIVSLPPLGTRPFARFDATKSFVERVLTTLEVVEARWQQDARAGEEAEALRRELEQVVGPMREESAVHRLVVEGQRTAGEMPACRR
jgi:hypothetical protein